MTLTVRLDTAVEAALDRYCAESGKTKSLVVQQCVAGFLLDRQPSSAGTGTRAAAAVGEPSANYRAFAEAGLIGAVALGEGSDKAAVRARIQRRRAARKARRSVA